MDGWVIDWMNGRVVGRVDRGWMAGLVCVGALFGWKDV